MKDLFLSKLFIFQLVLASVSVISGATIGISYELSQYKGRIYKNITIEGEDISGQSIEKAQQMMQDVYAKRVLEKNICIQLGEDKIEIPIEQFIARYNIEEAVQKAYEYPNTLPLKEKLLLLQGKAHVNFTVTVDKDYGAIQQVVDDIEKQYTKKPADASIHIDEKGRIQINPEQEAIKLHRTKLATQIDHLVSHLQESTISLSDYFVKESPRITTKKLLAIDTKVASYSTVFIRNTGSDINIALAAKIINGTLLMTNEIFSFNNVIGNTTLEKGYTYAPVIVNSKITQGVGGGVCQVSTTLYNAVLKIGLTPIERQNHSKPSKYVPIGLDAAIDWGTIDLKFKNTLEYPIYIVSYIAGNRLFVDFYSNHDLNNIDYIIRNEIYETLPASVRYIKDSSLKAGTKQLVSSGSSGYRVRTIREAYRDKKKVSTEIIADDSYRPSSIIYKVR